MEAENFEQIREAFRDLENKARAYSHAKKHLADLLTAHGGNGSKPSNGNGHTHGGDNNHRIYPKVKPGSLAEKVLNAIASSPLPVSNQKMLQMFEAQKNSLRGTLWNLKKRGLIDQYERGKWTLVKDYEPTSTRGNGQ